VRALASPAQGERKTCWIYERVRKRAVVAAAASNLQRASVLLDCAETHDRGDKDSLRSDAPADSIDALTQNDGPHYRNRSFDYYQAPRYW
jgi:hypothetical protein